MQGRRLVIALLVASLLGCDSTESTPPARPAAPVSMGEAFDPSSSGTIRGAVCWQGQVPEVPPLLAHLQPQGPPPLTPPENWPHPHQPRVDSKGGVQQAVVFLRGVDPLRATPWRHAPVRIEQRAHQYHIHQGEQISTIGFVRCGDSVSIDSTDSPLYSLHARGSNYLSMRTAAPQQPVTRVLAHPGHMELTSGLGRIWMRAHLFVVEHPYYTLTDEHGQFTLAHVPPGHYEVVCWLPNWKEEGCDLDPNTALPVRLRFRAPVQKVQAVRVAPRQAVTVRWTLTAADF